MQLTLISITPKNNWTKKKYSCFSIVERNLINDFSQVRSGNRALNPVDGSGEMTGKIRLKMLYHFLPYRLLKGE